MPIISSIAVIGVKSSVSRFLSSPSVAPEADSDWVKTNDPPMMNRIIVLIFAVSISAFHISRRPKSAPSTPDIWITRENRRNR